MNRLQGNRALLCLIGTGTAVLLFCYPTVCREAAAQGLQLCGGPLLIGIFPFLIVSNIIVASDCAGILAFPFRPIACLLGCKTPAGAAVLLLGALGGFAPAAVCAARMCDTEELTSDSAAILLAAAAVSSPAFVILSVGEIMLGSRRLGVWLYLTQLLAAYVSTVLYRLVFRSREQHTIAALLRTETASGFPLSVAWSLSDAVGSAALIFLKLSAFVVYFRIVSAGLSEALPKDYSVLPELFLELSSGCSAAAQRPANAVYWCCAVLSLQSLSVLLQIRAICPQKLSLKPLLAIRPLHLLLSLLFLKATLSNNAAAEVYNSLETHVILLPRLSPACSLLLFAVCVITCNQLCCTLQASQKTL